MSPDEKNYRRRYGFRRLNRMNDGNGKSRAAFTLVEVLLGMGIIAMSGLCIFLCYATAVRLDRDSAAASELGRDMFWAVSAIADDVERMVPYQYIDPVEKRKQPVCIGTGNSLCLLVETADSLQWVEYRLQEPPAATVRTTALGITHSGNIDREVLSVSTDGSVRTLLRRCCEFTGLPPASSADIHSEILAERISGRQGLQLSYARKAVGSGPDTLVWSGEWVQPEPPAAVRIIVRMQDADTGRGMTIRRDIPIPVGI